MSAPPRTRHVPTIVVAGVSSGVGKTTVTLGRVLASYVHLHFGSNPDLARHLIQACVAPCVTR